MGQPDLISHVEDLSVSIDIELLAAYMCLDVGGQIFLPDPERHFAAAFAVDDGFALTKIIHDLLAKS